MKIAYLALAVFNHEQHAGYTHHYHISKFMSALADVVLFFSGRDTGVLRESGPRMMSLVLPTSGRFFPNPIELIRSVRLASTEFEGTDIIHERFRYNPMELVLVKSRKYVLELNDLAGNSSTAGWNPLRDRVLRHKLKHCDAIVTQTGTLKKHIRRITDKPICIVPNGVDADVFNPSSGNTVRERLGLKKDDIAVVYAGSFRSWHGISTIIRAAELLSGTRKNVKFILVGNGQCYHLVERASRDLDNIILTGSVPMLEVPPILAASDICVAPFSSARFDNKKVTDFWWCPIKLFEYMASGKPIVTTRFHEVQNIVEDSALLFSPGDTVDFTTKLTSLIDNETLRQKLGKRARKLAVSKHSWEHRSKMLMEVYDSL